MPTSDAQRGSRSEGQPPIAAVPQSAADVDTLIFRGDYVAVGAFRCQPDHPLFGDSGPIRNHCFVFPRTAVQIEHANAAPFQGDPTTVTLYNPGQRYRRRVISSDGDHCDYFAIAPEVLRKALCRRDAGAADRDRLFVTPRVQGPPPLYFRQRQLFDGVRTGRLVDPLGIEESVLDLLDALLDTATRQPAWCEPSPRRHRQDLVEGARRLLATHLDRPMRLSTVAGRLDCSPFHVCRIFRSETGVTLHGYRNQLRLRRALELIEQGMDLTTVAFEVGYSSHSHFTHAFHRAFGTTPRRFRNSTLASVAAVEHRGPRLAAVR